MYIRMPFVEPKLCCFGFSYEKDRQVSEKRILAYK